MSGSVTYLTLQVLHTWRFMLMGLKPPSGLGPLLILSMNRRAILGFIKINLHGVDPAPPGRVIPRKIHHNEAQDHMAVHR